MLRDDLDRWDEVGGRQEGDPRRGLAIRVYIYI